MYTKNNTCHKWGFERNFWQQILIWQPRINTTSFPGSYGVCICQVLPFDACLVLLWMREFVNLRHRWSCRQLVENLKVIVCRSTWSNEVPKITSLYAWVEIFSLHGQVTFLSKPFLPCQHFVCFLPRRSPRPPSWWTHVSVFAFFGPSIASEHISVALLPRIVLDLINILWASSLLSI